MTIVSRGVTASRSEAASDEAAYPPTASTTASGTASFHVRLMVTRWPARVGRT